MCGKDVFNKAMLLRESARAHFEEHARAEGDSRTIVKIRGSLSEASWNRSNLGWQMLRYRQIQ